MPRRSKLVQGALVAAFAAASFALIYAALTPKHPWKRARPREPNDVTPISAAEAAETYAFTKEDREALRGAVVEWVDCESGAPYATRFTGPPPADPDSAVEILISFGGLESGSYSYDNPLADSKETEWAVESDGDEKMAIDKSPRVTFALTDEHLKLLRGGNIRTGGLDCKRPYGDMTCYEIDMSRLLGGPQPSSSGFCRDAFPESVRERFRRLHQSMVYALQVFLLRAVLEPGTYGRDTRGIGPWRPLRR